MIKFKDFKAQNPLTEGMERINTKERVRRKILRRRTTIAKRSASRQIEHFDTSTM